MEQELGSLENKLEQLINVVGRLRVENNNLRQELAHAASMNRQCTDKLASAKARLEKLLLTLPEETI
jgi:regulator of replication initiation timing